jgi:hypothetical protein
MGYINQASATPSNSPLFTFSAWVNLLASCNVNLLEFGYPYGADDFAANYVQVANDDGPFGNWCSVTFQGVIDEFNAISEYLTTTDEANDTVWQNSVDPSKSWTPKFFGSVGSLGSAVAAGTWFHLFVAADFTNTTVYGGATNTCFIFLNGARQNLDTGGGSGGPGVMGRIVNNATGQVQPRFLPSDSFGAADYNDGLSR